MENMMRRIKKLLNIANDKRADPNEAAAAAAMAERIMRKHQIELGDVLLQELNQSDSMATEETIATAKTNGTPVKRVPAWASRMAVLVRDLYDCGAVVVTTKDGQAGIRFYGYKQDVQMCRWMFDFLVDTTNRAVREYHKTDLYRIEGRKGSNDYRNGFVAAIMESLRQQIEQKKQDLAADESSTGRDLVVAKKNAVANHFGGGIFGTRSTRTRTRISDSNMAGHIDGSGVNVGRRVVEGSSSNGPILLN